MEISLFWLSPIAIINIIIGASNSENNKQFQYMEIKLFLTKLNLPVIKTDTQKNMQNLNEPKP